jgi:hypothetical protein
MISKLNSKGGKGLKNTEPAATIVGHQLGFSQI